MCRTNRYAGLLTSELIVAMSVLAILLVSFALSLRSFATFNHYQLVRQRCIAAAQAQLDSMTALGKPIPNDDLKRLWARLTVSVRTSSGTGRWHGLELVQVVATGKSYRKTVKVELSRYVFAESISAHGTKPSRTTEGEL